MSVRQVIALGLTAGVIGVSGQIPLMRFGLAASSSLRGMLCILIAVSIGVVTGTWASREGVKAAALAGMIAGTLCSIVGLGAMLMDPSVTGQRPFDSTGAFLAFVSSLIMGTVLVSWVLAGIAAAVAAPISLSRIAAQED